MNFSEFKKLVNEMIDLKVEIEDIKRKEYKKLPKRKQMNYNISTTLNNIENIQDVEEEYFSPEINDIIYKKKKSIYNIEDYLSKSLGDWTRYFWIDVKMFEEKLNKFFEKAQLEPRFKLEVEKQREQNIITRQTITKGQLHIESTNKDKYIIDIDEIGYDFSDIKNLIIKAVKRRQMTTDYIKLSPYMLSSEQWQEFESMSYQNTIRNIYWNTVKESVKNLETKRQELLIMAVENNSTKIEKLKEEIKELRVNSQICKDRKNDMVKNPDIIID